MSQNTSALWRVDPALRFQQSWTVAVAPGTSPAAAYSVMALQGSDGHLWIAAGAPAPTGLTMAPGTSPAIFLFI